MQTTSRPHLERLLNAVSNLPSLKTAVVHPVGKAALLGAIEAAKDGLIEPVLIGPEKRINKAAAEAGFDISSYEVIATEHSHDSAKVAVDMAREGTVSAIMKGKLHTDELMSAVVSREGGLRTDRRMSHVFAFDVPTYSRPLFITDAAININPDLETKADIIRNVIDLAHLLAIEAPRVAILSAVETVTSKIESTLHAAALCKMADRGQIKGALLDGPLAFDNAISEDSVKIKGIKSDVAGKAEVLVVPDIEAGNMLAKQLEYLANAEGAGIVLGAKVPVVLPSRADDAVSRLAACALAVMIANK
ncbi:MAG: bifunctional enoyl-CoA hydratase/phosphate acetyltransferase [Gammaproteobacteria bacterium]